MDVLRAGSFCMVLTSSLKFPSTPLQHIRQERAKHIEFEVCVSRRTEPVRRGISMELSADRITGLVNRTSRTVYQHGRLKAWVARR